MTYQFDTDIAALYGVDEAIMIANLQFWIQKNEANGKHFHEGRYWTYNSIEAFTKLFPFWTARQVRRVLKSLEDKGVIVTGNYNTSAYDRTTWYAFGDSFLQNGQNHFTEWSNGKAETGKCIINNDADIKPDSNPDIPADGGLFPSESTTPVIVKQSRRKPKCLFEDTEFADFEKFKAQFTEPDFADIDLFYYYNRIKNWSGGNAKKKADWILTAKNWMMDDADKGKLHRLGGGSALSPDAIEYLKDMAR